MVARATRQRGQALSLAVDTNVIIGLVAGTQAAAELASTVLEKHAERQGLLICPIVYAELFAHPGWSKKEMDAFLRATTIGVQWEIAREVWEAAAEQRSPKPAGRFRNRRTRRSDRRSHHRRCGLLSHELPRPSPHNHVIARRERRIPEPNSKKIRCRAFDEGVAVAALND